MNLPLLINSLSVAGGSALLAVLLGVSVALVALVSPRTVRVFLVTSAIAVLALPAFLVLNAWLAVFGVGGKFQRWLPFPLFSLPTALLIEGLLYWPIAFLLVFGAWQRLTPDLVETDPLLRGSSMLRWLLWPACRAAAQVAFAVTFVLCLNQFSVPALLQVRVYPAEVWIRYNTGLDPFGALLLGWPMVLAPALLLLWAWQRDVPWPRLAGGLGCQLARRRLGGVLTTSAALLGGIGLAFSFLFPLIHLLFSEGTWAQLPAAVQAGSNAAVQTFLLAALSATLVTLLALGAAHWRTAAVSWLGFLVPGVLIGIVLIKLFNRPPWMAFYQSILIVLVAWSLRFFAPGWALVRRALRTIDPVLRDALRLEGAGRWSTFRLVVWPQTSLAIGAAWYLAFLLCLWDTETLILVMPPGGETLALRIFNFLHYGHNGQINALCLVLLSLALVPLALWAIARLSMRLLAFSGRQARTTTSIVLALVGVASSGCQPPHPSQAHLDSPLFERVEVLGERGSGPGQFQKPRSLAVDRRDNLYVVDMTGRVQRFSSAGEYRGFWQMPETDLGKPKGMCLDEQGAIVVVEPHYARINHFAPEGRLLQQWGVKGTKAGQIGFPRAIAVSPQGHAFVAEYLQRERIQVFDSRRKFLRELGRAGSGPGEFNRAEGLALDGQGRLYVADSCNHRVQIFTENGKLLRALGKPGSGPGEMSYPYDVAVDSAGYLYVCEFGNSRIQIFDPAGRWLETLGGAGAAPGRFSNPWSIALDSQGNLYVADSLNHRVQKLIRRSTR